jgi:hypothetical protein
MRISVANLAYHLVPVSPFHAVNSILGALIALALARGYRLEGLRG